MVTQSKRVKRTLGRSLPATQNKVTKQATIVTGLTDEAVDAMQIVRLMIISSLVTQKRKAGTDHDEIRGFDEDGSAFLSERTGLPKRKCFSKGDHIKIIMDLYRTIPVQFRPKKWLKLLATE